MQNNFIDNMQKAAQAVNPNVSVTENGAVGYQTTGKSLLDLNFKLSSMRNWSPDEIWKEFLKAYNDYPALSVVWLFFARDARQGCGERRTFRVIFQRLASENPELAVNLLNLLPEYGRWDDLIDVFSGNVPCKVRDKAFLIIKSQLLEDIYGMKDSKSISLLAKWLPSENTSSKETRRRAEMLRSALRYSPRYYRKTLTALRKHLSVVEQCMSANEWSEINYESVPSKAGLNYRDAFIRHDGERYEEYLSNVKDGKAKMNASVLFPYEIVHAYTSEDIWSDDEIKPYDETLELKWLGLPDTVPDGAGTLVVVDGSGSMGSRVGNTKISCHDVARSIGIYFAEHLRGPLSNSIVTFSSSPKVVRFNGVASLNGKLKILADEQDCSNTNIEKTFDLILKTAVDNHMKQEDMPANLLIISDMEFDACTRSYSWSTGWTSVVNKKLFEEIADKYAAEGYKLPRLVFWNVCSRTGTIPVTENELGVALVSGFSQNIASMVMSGELDPWKLLVRQLRNERYEPVRRIVMPS